MNDSIIDVHGHLPPAGHPACVEDIIASMQVNSVEKMLISSLGRQGWPPYPDARQVRQANEDVFAACAAYPGRFRAYIYLNPRLQSWPEEFNRWRDHPHAVGIKLWIALLDDQGSAGICLPVLHRAAERGLVVLFHSFYRSGGQLPGELNPARIAALARQVPHVRVIIAHMGGNWTKTARAVIDCGNVYTDVSGGPPARGSLEVCAALLGAERVLFGSDCICRTIASQRAKVDYAQLKPQQRRLIFRDNACRLFGGRLS